MADARVHGTPHEAAEQPVAKVGAWTRRIELRVLHCMAWRWARDRGRGRRHRCG